MTACLLRCMSQLLAHRVDSLRCEGSDAMGAKRTCRERRERLDPTKMPSRPGEFHPEPLTEPDLILSHHTARATARRLPPSIEHRVPPVAGCPNPNGDAPLPP